MATRKNLSTKQQKAIEYIALGKLENEILQKLNISRSTLWVWKNQNITFQQELEKAKKIHANVVETRLKELSEESSKILLEVLRTRSEGYVKVALEIFKLSRPKNIDEQPKQTPTESIGQLLELKFGGKVANG